MGYAIERNYVETGKTLAIFRRRVNLSQREVGQYLGYSSAQFISNIEAGIQFVPIEKLKKLTKLYGMKPDYIINIYFQEERKRMYKIMGIKCSNPS